MNLVLTTSTQRLRDCFGRFMPQARAIWARGALIAQQSSCALLSFIRRTMDDAVRIANEMLFADRLAVRRLFLVDPMARGGEAQWRPEAARTIARWAKQAHYMNHSYAPEVNAEMKGMQKMLDIILADVLDDMPDFVRLMAREEARRQEEIVPA